MHTCSRDQQCARRSRACRRVERGFGVEGGGEPGGEGDKRRGQWAGSESVAQGLLQAQNDGSGCPDRGPAERVAALPVRALVPATSKRIRPDRG